MSSYLALRHTRSINRLPSQRPRPSMLTSTPADSTASINTGEANRELATAINRMLQVQFVQPSHQRQVFVRLRTTLVIVAAATQFQQLALMPYTDSRVGTD